jgi:hypothetical protein
MNSELKLKLEVKEKILIEKDRELDCLKEEKN